MILESGHVGFYGVILTLFVIAVGQRRLLPFIQDAKQSLIRLTHREFGCKHAVTRNYSLHNVGSLLSYNPVDFCDPLLRRVNASCPRFIAYDMGPSYPGLGDRFMQLLLQSIFAMDAKATPIWNRQNFDGGGKHGSYGWANEFFNINLFMLDQDEVMETYNISDIITLPSNVTSYAEALGMASLRCNATVKIHFKICDGTCYYPGQQQRFQRLHHVLECAFLKSNWSALPTLLFDPINFYTVAIHIRSGDINLHADAPSFFRRLHDELEYYLEGPKFKIHYIFIAEAPEKGERPTFDFLGDIFHQDPPRAKVSYLNTLTVPEALFHMMNADILVTTGSSLPYIAVTLSSKPVIVFGKPKEHRFFSGLLREDLIHLEDDGSLVFPSPPEIRALISMKFVEVHGKVFPFDFNPGQGNATVGLF